MWVVLERHGEGLIAKWTGVDQPLNLQTICSFGDADYCLNEEVELVDLP